MKKINPGYFEVATQVEPCERAWGGIKLVSVDWELAVLCTGVEAWGSITRQRGLLAQAQGPLLGTYCSTLFHLHTSPPSRDPHLFPFLTCKEWLNSSPRVTPQVARWLWFHNSWFLSAMLCCDVMVFTLNLLVLFFFSLKTASFRDTKIQMK